MRVGFVAGTDSTSRASATARQPDRVSRKVPVCSVTPLQLTGSNPLTGKVDVRFPILELVNGFQLEFR